METPHRTANLRIKPKSSQSLGKLQRLSPYFSPDREFAKIGRFFVVARSRVLRRLRKPVSKTQGFSEKVISKARQNGRMHVLRKRPQIKSHQFFSLFEIYLKLLETANNFPMNNGFDFVVSLHASRLVDSTSQLLWWQIYL